MKYRAIRWFDAGTGVVEPGAYYNGPCIAELLMEGCLECVEGEPEASEGEVKADPEPKGPPKRKAKAKLKG